MLFTPKNVGTLLEAVQWLIWPTDTFVLEIASKCSPLDCLHRYRH